MSGYDILRATVLAQELGLERERHMMIRHHRSIAEARSPGQVSKLSWFGGIKATARFLSEAAREDLSRRRLTEAHG